MQVLRNLLRDILSSKGFNSRNSIHVRLQVTASEYSSGYPISSLQYMDENSDEFISQKSLLRFSQGVVAKRRIYGPKLPILHKLIPNQMETSIYPSRMYKCGFGLQKYYHSFEFIPILIIHRAKCTNYYICQISINVLNKSCVLCSSMKFQVLKYCQQMVQIKIFRYLRLHWQRHERTLGTASSSKHYGLIPIYSIRGLASIIPADVEIFHRIKRISER